jgi:hypothetical protein
MHIEKNTYDKNYPYTIFGDWGEELFCDREGLIALKREIDRVLDQPSQPQPRVATCGNIGGQMVQRMIEAYEGRRRK